MKIEVYTDGSCLHNGRIDCVGGWAAIFFMKNKIYARYGHLPAQSSNNKAELMGILYILKTFQDMSLWNIQIYSDSQYCVKGINEWRRGFEARDFMGVANSELFIPIFDAWDAHGDCRINWVRGHNGNAGNELADLWAGKGMRNIDESFTDDKIDVKFISNFQY